MTSAWLQSRGQAKDAPLTTDTDPYKTQSYNLAKATNADIDALNADKDRYFQSLNDNYQRMFDIREKLPGQLLSMTKSGVALENERRKWVDTEEKLNVMWDAISKGEGAAVELQGDNDPRVLWDKDIARDVEIQNRINSQRAEVNDAAHMANAEGRQELAAQILRVDAESQEFWRNKHNVEIDGARYLDNVGLTLPVELPGQFYPDGTPIKRSFNEAQSLGEARYILGKIYANYMHSTRSLAGKRPGRWKREIAIPMAKKFRAKLLAKAKDLGAASAEVQEELRGEELETRLSTNPEHFLTWMDVHKGAYGGSYREARRAASTTIARYAADGSISRGTVEDVLDTEFVAHDGTKQTIGEYWKEEAAIMIGGVNKFEKEEIAARLADKNQALLGEFNAIQKEYAEADSNPTQDEKQGVIANLMSTHGVGFTELPDEVKNWYAQGEGDDNLLDYELTKRLNNGEALTAADLQFSDPMKKAEWLKKIGGSGSMDTSRRDSFIIGKVDWKTQNTLGEDGRGDEWRAYQDNATIEFNRAFMLAKINGASDSEAMKAGMDVVVDGLTKDDSWSKWGGTAQDPNSVTNLGKARIAVGKDRTLIDSDKPWVGEEANVEFAVKYLQGKSTNIPQYYRSFPNIKMQPIQLMKRRMVALGLLKEGEWVLPEEEIRPDLQNLFIKPSPAKTYRVITDEDQGPDWVIKQYNDGSRDNDEILNIMLQNIRQQSQRAQRYSTTDIAYRNTVEIPPELNEEFTAQVGELPVYLQLANLQPEVAKALVADTLMT